jgi:tRNA threonylcarbamoyladenosine biosynthesis protein TsaB
MHQRRKTGRPLILAVETSGRAGSLAIGIGREIFGRQAFSGPMRHSAELFPAISDLLEQIDRQCSEIEQVYISAGPGSFTGIRIAVTLAKTMHLANPPRRTRIVAVNTMQVIAENAAEYMKEKQIRINKIATILDAKRGQFYVAVFERQNDCWVRCLPDCLMRPEEFVNQFTKAQQPVWLLGEGLVYYAEAFRAEGILIIEPTYWPADARKLYKVGWEMALAEQFADPVTLVPFYLREPDVREKSGK